MVEMVIVMELGLWLNMNVWIGCDRAVSGGLVRLFGVSS